MIYTESILLCVAIPLAIMLIFVRGNARQFVSAVLIGMTIGLLSSYVTRLVGMIFNLGDTVNEVYISPIVEEWMKILPLVLFLLLFEPDSRVFTLTALAVGAGFAVFDNCCYMLTSGVGNLMLVIIRSLSVGVMHIAGMLALALWLVILRQRKMLTAATILGAVAIPTAFHALFNLLASRNGVSLAFGYILPIVTAIFLIYLYRRMNRNAESEGAENKDPEKPKAGEIEERMTESEEAPLSEASEEAGEKDRDGEEVGGTAG